MRLALERGLVLTGVALLRAGDARCDIENTSMRASSSRAWRVFLLTDIVEYAFRFWDIDRNASDEATVKKHKPFRRQRMCANERSGAY